MPCRNCEQVTSSFCVSVYLCMGNAGLICKMRVIDMPHEVVMSIKWDDLIRYQVKFPKMLAISMCK